MSLPEITHANAAEFLNEDEIVHATAEQIMKDFGMFGVQITYSGHAANAYIELHQQLTQQVDMLMNTRYETLQAVLYQVDINRAEMLKAAASFPQYNHVELMAHQIIFRELKKVLYRRYFR